MFHQPSELLLPRVAAGDVSGELSSPLTNRRSSEQQWVARTLFTFIAEAPLHVARSVLEAPLCCFSSASSLPQYNRIPGALAPPDCPPCGNKIMVNLCEQETEPVVSNGSGPTPGSAHASYQPC